MIVCSLPRCGATKFCLDLQETTNLQFVGELNPYFITELNTTNVKATTHETAFQLNYSADKFASLLYDHSSHIVLINESSHLVVNQADYVILRHQMKDAFLSTADYLLRMFPNIKANEVIHMLDRFYRDYIGLQSYLNKYDKDVVWYEDYFGIEGTSTPLLNQHLHSKKIVGAIEDMFNA